MDVNCKNERIPRPDLSGQESSIISKISKKGIIIVSAVAMIMAGALVAVLPPSSDGCGHGGHGSYTKYVYIPILNNTEQTLTISKIYFKVPGECYEGGKHHTQYNETRVSSVEFGGTQLFASSYGNCCCSNPDCNGVECSFNQNGNEYDFSSSKVLCKITIKRDENNRPTGTYTVKYWFGFPGEATDANTNTLTFDLS